MPDFIWELRFAGKRNLHPSTPAILLQIRIAILRQTAVSPPAMDFNVHLSRLALSSSSCSRLFVKCC